MQIIVCVKSELDATGPIKLIEPVDKINTKDLVQTINPADHAALTLVRNSIPHDMGMITVITVSPASAEKILRICLASGADNAVRVWDESLKEENLNAKSVASLLHKAIQLLKADLVVCGSEGLCETSGYIGPALAELLDAAQICRVDHMEVSDDKQSILFHRKHNYGNREVITCLKPAVITVDYDAAKPPAVSMKESIKASKVPIMHLDLESLGCKEDEWTHNANANVLQYMPPRPRTKKIKQASDKPLTPQQKMQQMLGGGAAKQSSNIIEGDSKKAAKEFVDFLIAERILNF